MLWQLKKQGYKSKVYNKFFIKVMQESTEQGIIRIFKNGNYILLLCSLIFVGLVGCSSSNPSLYLNFEKGKGTEPGGDFIQFNDSTIVKGDITKSVTKIGAFTEGEKGWVLMDGKKQDLKNVYAFQYNDDYCVRHPKYKWFMQRRFKGKLTVYSIHRSSIESYGTTKTTVTQFYYYLQKDGDRNIYKCTLKELKKQMADNQQAMNYLEEYRKARKNKDQYLVKAIEAYNLN